MSSDLKRIVSSKVPAEYAGQSLLNYLTSRYPYNSKDNWLYLITNGKLKVNGCAGQIGNILKKDDTVEYLYEGTEPEVDLNYSILYEDEDILIINKTGNLPIHPAGKFFNNTLWAELKKKYENIHFINRIDRETSGIVLIALNSKSASKLGKQIQSHSMIKEYTAVVEGRFPQGEIVKKGLLINDESSTIRKKLTFVEDLSAEGSSSVHTSFTALQVYGNITLLKCRIFTGKTHQIRATLKSIGYPLTGDKLYGVDENIYLKFINKTMIADDNLRLRIKRQALHASSLTFRHPVSGEEMTVTAPLPGDISEILENADD